MRCPAQALALAALLLLGGVPDAGPAAARPCGIGCDTGSRLAPFARSVNAAWADGRFSPGEIARAARKAAAVGASRAEVARVERLMRRANGGGGVTDAEVAAVVGVLAPR
jgi:hypothetical protein